MTRITYFVSELEFTCTVSNIRLIAESRHCLSVKAKALEFVLLFMIFSRESPQKSGLLSVKVLPRYSWHPTEESCQEKLKSLDLKMFSETLSLDLKILEIFLSTGQFVAFSCSANVSVMVLDQLVDEADLSAFRTKVFIKLLSTHILNGFA